MHGIKIAEDLRYGIVRLQTQAGAELLLQASVETPL
jgi:hypothetical protein